MQEEKRTERIVRIISKKRKRIWDMQRGRENTDRKNEKRVNVESCSKKRTKSAAFFNLGVGIFGCNLK